MRTIFHLGYKHLILCLAQLIPVGLFPQQNKAEFQANLK